MIDFKNNGKTKLVVVAGPTAVGKSEYAVNLAIELNGEIISADSMQVYKYMDIGTAKISENEMKGIKHHLIDIINPDEDYDIFSFKQDALKLIDDITSRGHIPIICGGTGFYIQAVTKNVEFNSNKDYEYIKELQDLLQTKGPKYLHNMLAEVDKEYADSTHYNNAVRIINALEFNHSTNLKLSSHNKNQFDKEIDYDLSFNVLNIDRQLLYDRINLRVDKMIEEGLIDEVKSLRDMGYSPTLKPMQGLGYKEINEYLDGLINLDTAINLIKQNTRHYAKRQITWFKREKDANWIEL